MDDNKDLISRIPDHLKHDPYLRFCQDLGDDFFSRDFLAIRSVVSIGSAFRFPSLIEEGSAGLKRSRGDRGDLERAEGEGVRGTGARGGEREEGGGGGVCGGASGGEADSGRKVCDREGRLLKCSSS